MESDVFPTFLRITTIGQKQVYCKCLGKQEDLTQMHQTLYHQKADIPRY